MDELARAQQRGERALAAGLPARLDEEVGAHRRSLLGGAGGGGHHVLGRRVVAGDVGGDPALADDEHPVGHAEHLGQLAGDHQDRQALAGQLGEQPVHLGLGADVDAAGGLVDDQQLRVGGQPLGDDDLLLVAAAHGGGLHVQRVGLDLEAVGPRPGGLYSAPAVRKPALLEAAADDRGDVLADRALDDQALLAAVLGHERDAGPDGRARVVRRGRACRARVTEPASYASTPKTARAISLRPAPTRPASPTISPARTWKETPWNSPAVSRPSDVEDDVADRRPGSWGTGRRPRGRPSWPRSATRWSRRCGRWRCRSRRASR